MQTILLCVNARLLQSGVHSGAGGQIDAVRRFLVNQGCRVELVETVPFADGPTFTREKLLALAPDGVLVCGGDGTVFDALQSVAGTRVALGVIPFGTANILAQNLHLRGSAVAIAGALLSATPRPIRLGRVRLSGPHAAAYHFLCAAGAGPHAAVMELATRQTKRVAGKGAYWAAGIRAWLQRPPAPFVAEVTDSRGITASWRVCEAVALRVLALNVWRPGGALDASLLRLAMVPATTRFGFASAITRAIVSRQVAELTSAAELAAILRNSGEPGGRLRTHVSVFYQDVVRVVCRPPGDQDTTAPWVQADGELLHSGATTLEMAEESVHLLAPTLPSMT